MCEVFRQLDHRGVAWHWQEEHAKAWEEVKRLTTTTTVLAHYGFNKETTIQCDASSTGLGAILLQEGKPVCFASRALTTSERNYAQIEKELLAILFGCERFDQCIYAKHTTLESDHKPLEDITRKPMADVPKQLQQMLMRLQRYDIQVTYKKGSEMYLADALSGAYLKCTVTAKDWQREHCLQVEEVNMVEDVPIDNPLLEEIRRATKEDQDLQCISEMIRTGWPSRTIDVPVAARPFHQCHHEISVQNDLVFKGGRIVIPIFLRGSMVSKLHNTHLGVECCLRRARESLFWPGMNAELKDFVRRCSVCAAYCPEQCCEPLQPHEIPSRPWQKVAIDLFSLESTNYIVVVNYYSNFFEIDKLNDTLSNTVIHKVKGQFARHGIPEIVVTDNGPQFAGGEFERFATQWQFHHITTSPRYPQANGKVENTVKTCKSILKKAKETNQDVCMSLLDFRNTPSESIGSSPAQRLFGRRTRTQILISPKLLQPTALKGTDVSDKLHRAKQRHAWNYDKVSKSLPPLAPGQNVKMKKPGETTWSLAVFKRPAGHRSYIVESGGRQYRRNHRQLRTTEEDCRPSPLVSDDSEEDDDDEPDNDDVVPDRRDDTTSKQATVPIHTPPPMTVQTVPDNKKTARVRTVKIPRKYRDYDMS